MACYAGGVCGSAAAGVVAAEFSMSADATCRRSRVLSNTWNNFKASNELWVIVDLQGNGAVVPSGTALSSALGAPRICSVGKFEFHDFSRASSLLSSA